jgi:predicted DNA-binding protein
MTKEKKSPTGKLKADKDTYSFRLLRTTRARLDEAIVKTGLTQSSYVEKALLAEFKKDGV